MIMVLFQWSQYILCIQKVYEENFELYTSCQTEIVQQSLNGTKKNYFEIQNNTVFMMFSWKSSKLTGKSTNNMFLEQDLW